MRTFLIRAYVAAVFGVISFVACSCGGGGGSDDASLQSGGVPAAPTALIATPTSSTSIQLSWTDNASDETGFIIERATSDPFSPIASVGPNVTSFHDSGLAPSGSYSYRVRATGAGGDSEACLPVTATTLESPIAAPSSPTNVQVFPLTMSSVRVTWADSSSDETGFKIERATAAAGPFQQVAVTEAGATSWADSGLSPSTEYWYQVRATNQAGDSEPGGPAVVNTPAAPFAKPNPPSGVQAEAVSWSTIRVTWTDASTDEIGFKIERAAAAAGPFAHLATAAANATAYQDTGLPESTTYWYRVIATNSAGDSDPGAVANATTPARPSLAPPTNLLATVLSWSAVRLTWEDNAATETGFRIERATAEDGPFSQAEVTEADVKEWRDDNLSPSTEYWYRVRATGATGDSAPAGPVRAKTFDAPGPSHTLTVARTGAGSGSVAASPGGIACGDTCFASYTEGATVELTAVPSADSVFGGWTGCDSSSGASCTVNMTAARTVNAAFDPVDRTLTVTKTGPGGGTVTSSPAGITCGADCFESYPSGTSVSLMATPASDSIFSAWSGCSSVSGNTCTALLSSNKTVSAGFAQKVAGGYTLTISKGGSGSGTISGGGFSCGTTCTGGVVQLPPSTVLTLTATPGFFSTFGSWTGCTSVSGPSCTIMMNANKTVSATFNTMAPPQTLTVIKDGKGSGTIMSNPPGIVCGTTCTASYQKETTVTLTALPEFDSIFKDWAGCDSASGASCTVAMTAAKTVTATFVPPSPPAAPSNIAATSVTQTSAVLSWTDNATNETTYEVGSCTGVGTIDSNGRRTCESGFTAHQQLAANTTSYTVTGLSPDMQYEWYVRTRNSGGASSAIGVPFQTLAVPALVPPVLVGPSSAFVGNPFQLTWTYSFVCRPSSAGCIVSTLDGYQLQESTHPSDGFSTIFSTVGQTDHESPRTHTITKAAAGTYYYRVRASNGELTPWSNVVTVTAIFGQTNDATLKIVNQAKYDIITLKLNNVSQFSYPYGIPVGQSADFTFTSSGSVNYYIAVGNYNIDTTRNEWFVYTGSQTVTAGHVTTVDVPNPTISQLLSNFGTQCDWLGEYWTSAGMLNLAVLRFTGAGGWTLYDNNVQAGTGTVSLVSWPNYADCATFKLCFTCPEADLCYPFASFYLENGPVYWPIIRYVKQ